VETDLLVILCHFWYNFGDNVIAEVEVWLEQQQITKTAQGGELK